jgi:hypothetical protein
MGSSEAEDQEEECTDLDHSFPIKGTNIGHQARTRMQCTKQCVVKG